MKKPSKAAPSVNKSKNAMQIPLELKIIKAASKSKKLIERIIGFTDFDWHYAIEKFNGTCSKPVPFTLFDEVLCDLLLTSEMSLKKIGEILGLDTETDPAEKKILLSAIEELKKDKMVDGDESIYWLTDIGAEYAKNGEKFSTYTKQFDLYIDMVGSIGKEAKEIFGNLKSGEPSSLEQDKLSQNIDEIKILAEFQAPEIHFPKKNFLLQEAQLLKVEYYKTKVWIVLLENFRDGTISSLIYDEKQDKIIEPLSNAFDKMEDDKLNLLEKIIKADEDKEFVIQYTEEEKREEQIAIENELIQKQQEVENAIERQDIEKIKEIKKEVIAIKRHFNSLEFEMELQQLFEQTANDLWIISPWIKQYATFKRIPLFEKYLQKGGRIFVAYSEPENETDIMADEEALDKLLELEKTRLNFYICQLPKFHYKKVWLRNTKNNDLYYNGSYNIMSFFAQQNSKKVRQEEMIKLDWDNEKADIYNDIFSKFGIKYLNRAIEEFNAIDTNLPKNIDKAFLQKVKKFDYDKLKPFIDKGLEIFDKKYQQLQEYITIKLQAYRKQYVQDEIKNCKNEALELSKHSIPSDKKRSMQSRLKILLNEFPECGGLAEFEEVSQLIANLKIPDEPINQTRKKSNKKRR
jgi:hypothetical protein